MMSVFLLSQFWSRCFASSVRWCGKTGNRESILGLFEHVDHAEWGDRISSTIAEIKLRLGPVNAGGLSVIDETDDGKLSLSEGGDGKLSVSQDEGRLSHSDDE